MQNITGLIKWYSNWQYAIVSGFVAAVAALIYLPFVLGVPLLPLLAFIHRFSLTFEFGSIDKTVTVLVFVAPVIILKALWDWRHGGWKEYPRGIVWLGVLLFLTTNVYAVVISENIRTSSINLVLQLVNYGLFFAVGWWFFRLSQSAQAVQRKAVRWFVLSFIIIIVVNIVVSWSQFVDCSALAKKCQVWASIEQLMPSKLLPVGHQVFSHRPLVIRAPGLFGDVNFNGAFLLLALIFMQLVASYGWIKRMRWKWWAVGLILAIMGTFVLTASRSALLSWVVVQIPLTYYLWWPWFKAAKIRVTLSAVKRVLAWGLAAVVVLTIGVWMLVPTGRRLAIQEEIPQYIGRITNVMNDDSAQTRLQLWYDSLRLAKRCSWLGCGLGTYSEHYEKYINSGNPEADPHSSYMLVLVEQGIPGFLALLFFLGATWVALWQWLKLNGKKVWTTRSRFLMLLPVMFLVAFPFYSVFSLSYYGLFLPMVWWWGNPSGEMLNSKSENRKK